ncbi:MAG TPA: dTMP kinase [Candidatus Bathyarchaeia archaeon]|nr:dTMP kinase [Candidatus Bathyarchaeia archaeon]
MANLLRSRLIAMEGIDQAGKKTQTSLLRKSLSREGFKVATLSFPIYSTSTGRIIRSFLAGRSKSSPNVLHMLYSLNRWQSLETITDSLKKNDFVICNRYTPSNLAYGDARGLSVQWLAGLDSGLPEPGAVFVLDVPVSRSFLRKTNRRDVNERDRGFLDKVRRNYRALARIYGWHMIDGTNPPEEVHKRILMGLRSIFL